MYLNPIPPRTAVTTPRAYLEAYNAISPRMNGREIPAKPASAMGIFSASVILSVLLQGQGVYNVSPPIALKKPKDNTINKTHVEKNSSGSFSRVNAFRSSPSGFKRPMLMTVLDKALRLKAAGGANALLDTRHMAIRRAAAERVATDFILN